MNNELFFGVLIGFGIGVTLASSVFVAGSIRSIKASTKSDDFIKEGELRMLKADVGFESRYSNMSSAYKPLVLRVRKLEKILAVDEYTD